MIIELSKKEIFDEVEKRSSLEGSAIPERFETVWSSEDEGHFLDSFWREGYAAAIQLLKRYVNNETINYTLNSYNKDEIVLINAEMPVRFNALLEGSVITDIKMMIACNILHGWLSVKHPEAALRYKEESKGYSEDLRVKLLYRISPENKAFRAIHDECNIYPCHEYLNEGKNDHMPMAPQWRRCAERVPKRNYQRDECECKECYPFGFDICK